jgi:PAS domain S-box-containing protein
MPVKGKRIEEKTKIKPRESISREHQLEIILNTSNDIISLISVEDGPRYRYASVNKAFLTVTNLTKEQVEGKYVEEVVPEHCRAHVIEKLDRVFHERQALQWEEVSSYPTGVRTGVLTITPVFNDEGECTMLVSTEYDITERKKAEEEENRVRHLLNERVKELTTLYKACQILQDETKPADIVLEELVSILPAGWQYPEITEARISLGEEQYKTPGFKPGYDIQSAEFVIGDSRKGMIEVEYTEAKKEEAEGPFLAEERSLINMLAEMLTSYFARSRVTEQLWREKELSDSVINSLPGVFYLQEITGEFIRWNKQFETVTGYTSEEIANIHSLDFFIEEDKKLILKKSMEVYTNGSASAEATILTKDGVSIPHYFTGQYIEYMGRPCIIGTGIDITERKEASMQVLKEKELSESIINSLPGIFYLFDDTGKYLRWNKNHETVPGYSNEEMQEMFPLDFFDESEKEIIKKRIEKVFSDGYADVEANFMAKDGQKTPYYFNGIRIEYEGRPCLMGVAFDISESKKAAEQLRKEKELSESIINTLPGIFYIFDIEGNHLLWNKNYETVTGYSHDELAGMKAATLVPDEEQELVAQKIKAMFTEGLAEAEVTLICKDGRRIVYYFHGISINYQGRSCVLGVGIDITELKKIEQELREAEIKFRTLVEKSQVGVYIVQKGKFVYVNPRFADIFGYTADELLNVDAIKTIISDDSQALVREKVRARMSGDLETAHYEVAGKKKDGTLNRVEFYGSRAMYEGQPTIIGTMVDITERKLAEEALQKSEANLHTIFDTTDTMYMLLDNNFQVRSFNHRAFDFIKKEFKQEVKLNTNVVDYFPGERHENIYVSLKKVLGGEHVSYETSYQEKRKRASWFYVRIFPIQDNEGRAFGMMVAVLDITEKKLLEQEIINQKVEDQKKMTRAVLNAQENERNKIGQELHDNVNQILVGAKMYLGLIGNEKPGTTDLIRQSIALIDNGINEIRSLTRKEVTPPRKIGLKDIIQTLVDNTNEHSSVKTSFVYATDPFVINNDLKLNIYRIIQEAINNVLKHADARNVQLEVKAGQDGLNIIIKDDGKGFDPASVKTRGVGIANMLNRVESYNGSINIDGNPESGCKIEITIPV